MQPGSKRTALSAGVVFGILTIGVGEAVAGGFAIREQSAYGQGSSFAGVAAGGALSSMFWNPATITQQPGFNVEIVTTGIFGHSTNTPGSGALLAGAPFDLPGTGNTADPAFVPSGYASWQLNSNIWLGLSFNAPFGLTVSFPDLWAGRNYAGNSSLKTYNATPTIAVKLNDWISFGAGVQIMYGKANLDTGLGPLPAPPFPSPFGNVNISGDGWSYGFTAGVTVTPGPNTLIGVGWRSALDLDIDGTMLVDPISPFLPATRGAVSTKVKLPDVVTLGIRQKLTPAWTVMGTVEWSNWSRIGTSVIKSANGPATIGAGPLTTTVALPFQYQDGWFFSGGAEYTWSDRLTVRGGVGYEISPITDSVRTPRLPDNDRIWTSVGLSYKVFDDLTVDLGYSHLFVVDTSVNITARSGNPWFNPTLPVPYVGSVDASVDIISFALRYRFAPPPAPMPSEPVLTRG